MSTDDKKKLDILPLRDLLVQKLSIPEYQRPYKWSTGSAALLIDDTFDAYSNNVKEYRLGTVILHENDGNYEIVDGQQRLTTISIIMFCLAKKHGIERCEKISGLLNAEFSGLSFASIHDNYEIITRKLQEIEKNSIRSYSDYLFDCCTMVKIIADNEQEAFQFFDSQNSRGKALEPHDLLKSYHLREMNDEIEKTKIEIVNEWEKTSTDELKKLFSRHLFPLLNWYKDKNGLYYSYKDINIFKGINKNNNYSFSIYNRAANLYIEQFNQEHMYELVSSKEITQFQLTQPLIAGKRFFLYTSYYLRLLNNVKQILESPRFKDGEIPCNGAGDQYTKELFINALMFFIDKFNLNALTDSRINLLYRWAYSIRLRMKAVYEETINKYAKGKSSRINEGLNIFSLISDMQNPSELDVIMLDEIKTSDIIDSNKSKYKAVMDRMGVK